MTWQGRGGNAPETGIVALAKPYIQEALLDLLAGVDATMMATWAEAGESIWERRPEHYRRFRQALGLAGNAVSLFSDVLLARWLGEVRPDLHHLVSDGAGHWFRDQVVALRESLL